MTNIPAKFEAYTARYQNLRLTRDRGILLAQFHTDCGEFVWNTRAHSELSEAFRDIALDPENLVVILAETAENFIGQTDYASWGPKAGSWQV